MSLEEYRAEMETCCRCSACKFIPLEIVKGYDNINICPSISRFNSTLTPEAAASVPASPCLKIR
jgi:hypothetical protein